MVGAAIAALLVLCLTMVARVEGASWWQIVVGAFGALTCALAASFIQWLVTGGLLRLERRPPPDADRPE